MLGPSSGSSTIRLQRDATKRQGTGTSVQTPRPQAPSTAQRSACCPSEHKGLHLSHVGLYSHPDLEGNKPALPLRDRTRDARLASTTVWRLSFLLRRGAAGTATSRSANRPPAAASGTRSAPDFSLAWCFVVAATATSVYPWRITTSRSHTCTQSPVWIRDTSTWSTMGISAMIAPTATTGSA